MPLVNSRKQAVLDHWYGATAPSIPSDYYIGLFTAAPGQDGTGGTEVGAGVGYARVQKANTTTNWSSATSANPSVKANATAITWGTATGSWGTVTHVGWFTALSGGTPVDWAALSSSQVIGSGTTPSFAIGQLITQLQG